MNDNLPELRDIHIPAGVSSFPPAYGWWVMLLSLIALIMIGKLFKILRKKNKKRYALKMLESIHTNNIVASALQISEILRRICVYKYPNATTLFGQEWINFLNQQTKTPLSSQAAKLLVNAPYISQQTKLFNLEDITQLNDFAQRWIGENL